jgi:glycosyltransferase involved in cell wall biosynthesis
MPDIALLYDDDAYTELLERPKNPAAGGPHGLMGRQVAGRGFLDAYLTHGRSDEMVALVRRRECADSLVRFCKEHPSSRTRVRRLRVVEERRFHDEFAASPPATMLYMPCPPEPKYAWARQHAGPGRFAISGVTHTLCSADSVGFLLQLLLAPFEPFDALICTSKAVVDMVRAVTGTYADFLRERHGGSPAIRASLQQIPLGVDPDRFRPATPVERAAMRQKLGIADDEIVVLFVGRLSHHAKAHPFPIYRGVAEAARVTGRRVRLVMAGWAANAAIQQAFLEGAEQLARGAIVQFVEGTKPDTRYGVWKAADIFISPSDNIQETFGLVVLEAMASGLPVVASDWDGYRDLVVEGSTGILVPTTMVRDATADATSRLLMGEINYDYFLAECSQAVAVDPDATGRALARLIEDPDLRVRMGAEGRQRILESFTWQHVVRSYEALWDSQEAQRLEWLGAASSVAARPGPAVYPAPEISFAGYPTRLLAEADRLAVVSGAEAQIERLFALPLLTHAADRRAGDPATLRSVLSAASRHCTVADLDTMFFYAGTTHGAGRATIAWMLKYGLLRVL